MARRLGSHKPVIHLNRRKLSNGPNGKIHTFTADLTLANAPPMKKHSDYNIKLVVIEARLDQAANHQSTVQLNYTSEDRPKCLQLKTSNGPLGSIHMTSSRT